LFFLPAGRAFSVDVWRRPALRIDLVPRRTLLLLQIQIGLVYFHAGLAKIGWDWLMEAQPLRIWLARQGALPGIGEGLSALWLAYAMSWAGMLYDLGIAFALALKRTRPAAFITVVVFHVLTRLLFPIGIFPWLMIASATIFFSPEAHRRLLRLFISGLIWILSKLKSKFAAESGGGAVAWSGWGRGVSLLLVGHILVQTLFPLRHFLYPGDVLWTEEGFRFAWKVMLVEKQGQAVFRVRDARSGRESRVRNRDYLTEKQEFMMSTQPDMILHFAHFLRDEYQSREGYAPAEVFAEVRVAMNGRPSRLLLRPELNLAAEVRRLWGSQPGLLLYGD